MYFMSYEFLIESAPVNQWVNMDVAQISENYWRGKNYKNFMVYYSCYYSGYRKCL